jgi:hypothetical protein
MKTLNAIRTSFIILIAGLFLTTSGFAGKPAKPLEKRYIPIQKKLNTTMVFPECCLDKGHFGETAEVVFILTDIGKIEVESIECECTGMEKCIRQQLSQITIPDAIHDYNQHFKVTFKLVRY